MGQTNQAPLVLRIITILGLIGTGLGVIMNLVITGLSLEVFIYALAIGNLMVLWGVVSSLVIYILYFFAYLGLRKMKRWGFYVFILCSILSAATYLYEPTFYNNPTGIVFCMLFMLYLLSLQKRLT